MAITTMWCKCFATGKRENGITITSQECLICTLYYAFIDQLFPDHLWTTNWKTTFLQKRSQMNTNNLRLRSDCALICFNINLKYVINFNCGINYLRLTGFPRILLNLIIWKLIELLLFWNNFLCLRPWRTERLKTVRRYFLVRWYSEAFVGQLYNTLTKFIEMFSTFVWKLSQRSVNTNANTCFEGYQCEKVCIL